MAPASFPSTVELLRTLPTASAILDRSMRYLAVNQLWRDAHRLGDGPIVGRGHFDVFPELDDATRAIFQRCLEGEEASRKADPIVRVDGHTDYMDWTVTPWRGDDDAIEGIILHSEIVTEREETRRRLDEDEAFIRALFDSSPIGMNLCRMNGLWVESNPAFLRIIGYSHEEADGGLTYWELTPGEYEEHERAQLEALNKTGRYGPYEKEFIRKDGSRIPVRLNGFIIERTGEKFIWSLIEDMTEQRALEEHLAKQRLQALQAAKLASIGEMASGIAHEINNPLQVIDARAFIIQRALREGQEISTDALDGIRQATDRAARIVRGLLKFAREEESQVREQSAADIARESLTYTAARMRSHGVEVECELKPEIVVRCSALELTQVLINLLNNAFDAVRDQHGQVRLEVEKVGSDVVFRVTDSGPGVPLELRDRLFEPFVTSKPHGTGLGLSISRGLIEAMGGSLSYQRIDDRSCFAVRLPAGKSR